MLGVLHFLLHLPGTGHGEKSVFLIMKGCAEFGHDAIAHILVDMGVVVKQNGFHVS